jgi:hypothetical protein
MSFRISESFNERRRFACLEPGDGEGFGEAVRRCFRGASSATEHSAAVSFWSQVVQKSFKNEAKMSFRINKTIEKWDKTKPISGAV